MNMWKNKCIDKIRNSPADAVLVAEGATFQYLSGCSGFFWQRGCMNNIAGSHPAHLLPEAVLYMDQEGSSTIFTIPSHRNDFPGHDVVISYMDQFEDTIAPYLKAERIAVGADCSEFLKSILNEADSKITILDGADEMFFPLRAIKDENEIGILRRLARFTDDAVMHVVRNLKEGMTQYEVEMMLMQYGFDHGIQDFSFPPTAGFKTRKTFSPDENFVFPRSSKLLPQTAIAFDVGYMNEGYCSDWGRTVYFGKAPDHVRNGYHALQQAQQYMVSKIIPGETRACDLYDFVAEEAGRLGFGDVLRFPKEKMLGHQIGIECHEFPMLNPQFTDILQPGMVFCSEPKMMFEGECYMRVEDMILVTEDGAEFLTQFDRSLFEI